MNTYLSLLEWVVKEPSYPPTYISHTIKWADPAIGLATYRKTFRNMTDLTSFVRSTRHAFVFWDLIRTIPNESHYELRFGLNRMDGLDLNIGRGIVASDPTIEKLDLL